MTPKNLPQEILNDPDLGLDEKIARLEAMEAEAIHMQESDAEGFGGGERSHLDDIKEALDQLKKSRHGPH